MYANLMMVCVRTKPLKENATRFNEALIRKPKFAS